MNPTNKTKVDALIREVRHLILEELAENLEVSHGSVYKIVKSLVFSKVRAHWVPRHLTAELKPDWTEILEQSQRDNIFGRLITGDIAWIHHYEPESKRQ